MSLMLSFMRGVVLVREPAQARVDEPALSGCAVQLLLLQKPRAGYAVWISGETLEGASALSFRVRRGTTEVLLRICTSATRPSHGTRDRRGLRRQGSNRFELVLLAAHRAREIKNGSQITIEAENDKNPSLRCAR